VGNLRPQAWPHSHEARRRVPVSWQGGGASRPARARAGGGPRRCPTRTRIGSCCVRGLWRRVEPPRRRCRRHQGAPAMRVRRSRIGTPCDDPSAFKRRAHRLARRPAVHRRDKRGLHVVSEAGFVLATGSTPGGRAPLRCRWSHRPRCRSACMSSSDDAIVARPPAGCCQSMCTKRAARQQTTSCSTRCVDLIMTTKTITASMPCSRRTTAADYDRRDLSRP